MNKTVKRVNPMKSIAFMMKKEEGSAMVIAVLVLMIVSIIGIESSNTASLEAEVAKAEKIARKNFYRAEGAALQGAQEVENATPTELLSRSDIWLHKNDEIDLKDESTWDYDGGTDDNTEVGTLSNTCYGVTDSGVPIGASLHMAHTSQLHEFSVYGRCVDDKQAAFIEMGYRRRF